MLCYIPDPDTLKSLPVIHGDVFDPEKQEQGYGVFYSVNGFQTAYKRTLEALTCLNAAYVDIDYPKAQGKPTEATLDQFKTDTVDAVMPSEPSFIIETKNGIHALWIFDEPYIIQGKEAKDVTAMLSRYGKLQLGIIDRFQGDPGAKDATRVLRLPNTWHQKDPNDPFLVKLLYASNKTYSFDDLVGYFLRTKPSPAVHEDAGTEAPDEYLADVSAELTLDDIQPPKQEPEHDVGTLLAWRKAGGLGKGDPIPVEALQAAEKEYPRSTRPSIVALMQKDGLPEGGRNQSLMIVANELRVEGWTEQQVRNHFDRYNGLSEAEIAQTIGKAFKRPKAYTFGWNHHLINVGQEEKNIVQTIIAKKCQEIRDREAKLRADSLAKIEEAVATKTLVDPFAVKAMETHRKMLRETRLQEAAMARADKDGQKNMFERYEHVIRERYPRLRYVRGGDVYLFEAGVYKKISDLDLKTMFLREMENDKLFQYRTDTNAKNKVLCFKSLPEAVVEEQDVNPDPDIVNVVNGLVRMSTGELLPHDPDYFTTAQLPVRYREGPLEQLCPRWLQFVKEVMGGNEPKMKFLQQVSGLCFSRTSEIQKAFIFLGGGSNGKSTYIDILSRLLTPANSSSLTLKDIQERFGLASLWNKTLNVVEEISNNYFESDVLKKLITGAEIMADRKFMDRLQFRSHAKFVFAVNKLPRINDTSQGLYRRFHILEWKATFGGKDVDLNLPEKLWAERDGIFLWCMKGWQEIVEQGGLHAPKCVIDASETFKEANSPLVEFLLRQYGKPEPGREMAFLMPIRSIFDAYQTQVRELGYQSKNFSNFLAEMQSLNHVDLAHVTVLPQKPNGDRLVSGLTLRTKPISPIQP
jgi:P4 family phage/plasmid primase-like protien